MTYLKHSMLSDHAIVLQQQAAGLHMGICVWVLQTGHELTDLVITVVPRCQGPELPHSI